MAIKSKTIQLSNAQVFNAANDVSSSVVCGEYKEAAVYIKVTAKSGVTPTVDLDVQTTFQNGSDWHKDSDIAQISDPDISSGSYEHPVHKIANSLGYQLRVIIPDSNSISSGGSFTLTITVVLKN